MRGIERAENSRLLFEKTKRIDRRWRFQKIAAKMPDENHEKLKQRAVPEKKCKIPRFMSPRA